MMCEKCSDCQGMLREGVTRDGRYIWRCLGCDARTTTGTGSSSPGWNNDDELASLAASNSNANDTGYPVDIGTASRKLLCWADGTTASYSGDGSSLITQPAREDTMRTSLAIRYHEIKASRVKGGYMALQLAISPTIGRILIKQTFKWEKEWWGDEPPLLNGEGDSEAALARLEAIHAYHRDELKRLDKLRADSSLGVVLTPVRS